MHKCPHCNKPGIGYIRKQFIGSKVPATCRACGGKVHNNRLKAILATLPFVVCWITARVFLDVSLFYWVLAPGLLAMVLLTSLWVPLEKASTAE